MNPSASFDVDGANVALTRRVPEPPVPPLSLEPPQPVDERMAEPPNAKTMSGYNHASATRARFCLISPPLSLMDAPPLSVMDVLDRNHTIIANLRATFKPPEPEFLSICVIFLRTCGSSIGIETPFRAEKHLGTLPGGTKPRFELSLKGSKIPPDGSPV